MYNDFIFIGLPYAALFLFVVGSVIRYRTKPFSVSSLSSQLLESRILYWGSHAFHIGIVTLFFGHLIGFLFPKSVISFTGHPTRLLIIEISALAFGLLSLFGIVTLIYRRLAFERLKNITSKMDIVVYVLILTQVISGLWIAYFDRWGSAWFAVSLAPYLKSIFLFSPKYEAVAAMPLSIKLHITSAFIFVGMVPFTRLMHFLVYPFVYIIRAYQFVIWNWDRKTRRSATDFNRGVKARNN
ncbi:respiratory nitrate reductase subunit gamma [Draconibacterium sp.]|uniref:respiratory nitrate reductase subunit gamma n=1 Tax=Draconibacterium sp. TaxID=1965318 RepID=UPI003568DE4E